MYLLEMSRKPRLFRLDERVLAALDELADTANSNTNQYVESILFDFLKHAGRLPQDATLLKDGRGGKRANAGKKPKKDNRKSDAVKEETHD